MSTKHYNALPPGYCLGEGDRYEIEGVLGQGGFGITYRAKDRVLLRLRAIKEYLPGEFAVRAEESRVRPKSAEHEENFAWGRRQFLQEARTLGRFDHANIVGVFDFFDQNETAYMVMAYCAGDSLQQRLRERRAPATEEEILAFALPLLDGLAVVHANAILHLDIKPANIYIRHDNQAPVLLDFGAAKQMVSEHSKSMGSVYTPGYAAIEQYYQSGKRGPWTDIYALGATMYHLATGNPPAEAPGRMESDEVVPAAQAAKGRFSPGLLEAIDASLRIYGKDRPQSCDEWMELLAPGRKAVRVSGGGFDSFPIPTPDLSRTESPSQNGDVGPGVSAGPSRVEVSSLDDGPHTVVSDRVPSPVVRSRPIVEEKPAPAEPVLAPVAVSSKHSDPPRSRPSQPWDPGIDERGKRTSGWHPIEDRLSSTTKPEWEGMDAGIASNLPSRSSVPHEFEPEKTRTSNRKAPPAAYPEPIHSQPRGVGPAAQSEPIPAESRPGPVSVPSTGRPSGRRPAAEEPLPRPSESRPGPISVPSTGRPSGKRSAAEEPLPRPSKSFPPRVPPAVGVRAPGPGLTLVGWLATANVMAGGLHFFSEGGFAANVLGSLPGGPLAQVPVLASLLGIATWGLFEVGAATVAKPTRTKRR